MYNGQSSLGFSHTRHSPHLSWEQSCTKQPGFSPIRQSPHLSLQQSQLHQLQPFFFFLQVEHSPYLAVKVVRVFLQVRHSPDQCWIQSQLCPLQFGGSNRQSVHLSLFVSQPLFIWHTGLGTAQWTEIQAQGTNSLGSPILCFIIPVRVVTARSRSGRHGAGQAVSLLLLPLLQPTLVA